METAQHDLEPLDLDLKKGLKPGILEEKNSSKSIKLKKFCFFLHNLDFNFTEQDDAVDTFWKKWHFAFR